MICHACRTAALLRPRPRPAADDAGGGESVRQLRLDRHALCRGGTWCDCQHRTGASDPRAAEVPAGG
jgi:hypothetical protein